MSKGPRPQSCQGSPWNLETWVFIPMLPSSPIPACSRAQPLVLILTTGSFRTSCQSAALHLLTPGQTQAPCRYVFKSKGCSCCRARCPPPTSCRVQFLSSLGRNISLEWEGVHLDQTTLVPKQAQQWHCRCCQPSNIQIQSLSPAGAPLQPHRSPEEHGRARLKARKIAQWVKELGANQA